MSIWRCVGAGMAGFPSYILQLWEHLLSEYTDHNVEQRDVTSFSDLGKDLWSYLTGKGAAINYQFVDMLVEVPHHTGPDAARATWRLHGTLRITTAENTSGE